MTALRTADVSQQVRASAPNTHVALPTRAFMRTLRIPLALCIAVAGQAAAKPAMSPEQAFDLFARAVLESDANASAELHRAMQEANHDEAQSVSDLHRFVPDMVEGVVVGLTEYRVFPAKSAEGYGALMARAYARSHCRATGTRAAFQHEPAGAAIGIVVQFSCEVPAWNAEGSERADAATLRKMRKSTKYAFRAQAAMLKRDEKRTLAGETMLTGHHETGYFPDAYNLNSLMPVVYSVVPAERVDPFADMEPDAE